MNLINICCLVFFLLVSSNMQSMAIITIPKCGTHLVEKCLMLILDVQGLKKFPWCNNDFKDAYPSVKETYADFSFKMNDKGYVIVHAYSTDNNIKRIRRLGFKVIFLYRDPRDHVVSFAYFLPKLPWLQGSELVKLNMHARIKALLTSYSFFHKEWLDPKMLSTRGVADFYNFYLPWMNEPHVYTTSFEKLVGPRGGGLYEVQIQEIMNIAEYIGFPITKTQAHSVAEKLFGDTYTFREGKIGSWKKEFSPENLALFKSNQDNMQMLVDLGYEKDFNW